MIHLPNPCCESLRSIAVINAKCILTQTDPIICARCWTHSTPWTHLFAFSFTKSPIPYSAPIHPYSIKHRIKLKRERHKYKKNDSRFRGQGTHIVRKELFLSTSRLQHDITVGEGSIVSARGRGNIKLTNTVCVKNVCFPLGWE